jgi:hypothetical protein
MRHLPPTLILLTLVIGLQHSGIAQSASDVSFEARSFPARGEPRAIVSADFNGDGAADVATANLALGGTAASGVAVFPGNGDGTFKTATAIATGAGAFDLVTADVNRDGRTDLAVANADADTVSILLGSPAGLVPAFTWHVSASPRSLVFGDFTRDGRIDLAVAGYDCNCVDIGQGRGDGTFATVNTFSVGLNPEDLVAADFNRDGTLDLYVAHVAGQSAAILLGSGGGMFVEVRHDPNGTRTRDLELADFDGDGRIDVVHVGETKFRIELDVPGNSVYGADVAADSRGVAVFDVNSDGWPDAAIANRGAAGVQVLVNTSGGPDRISFLTPPPRFATAAGARAIAAADVDGDGRVDLIVANQSANSVTVLRNRTPRAAPTTIVR